MYGVHDQHQAYYPRIESRPHSLTLVFGVDGFLLSIYLDHTSLASFIVVQYSIYLHLQIYVAFAWTPGKLVTVLDGESLPNHARRITQNELQFHGFTTVGFKFELLQSSSGSQSWRCSLVNCRRN